MVDFIFGILFFGMPRVRDAAKCAMQQNGGDVGQQQGDAPQGGERSLVLELPAGSMGAGGCHPVGPRCRGVQLPSEVHDVLVDCWLDGSGVRRLLMLRGVNKAFQRRVDQHVLAIIKDTTGGAGPTAFAYVDAEVMREPGSERAVSARHMAVHWMALGCLSYVREAEMRDESIRRQHMRSFMYMMALRCFGKMGSGNVGAFTSISRALRHESQWYSKDGSERDALCRCVRVRARACVRVCMLA